jgi:hypothetical protein
MDLRRGELDLVFSWSFFDRDIAEIEIPGLKSETWGTRRNMGHTALRYRRREYLKGTLRTLGLQSVIY